MSILETALLSSFLIGCGMGITYFLFSAVFAHRHIGELDAFAGRWAVGSADTLIFKVLRLGVYAMACAWSWASRRMYPGKDFSMLPGRMKLTLIIAFWWFVIAFIVFFSGAAISIIFEDALS